MSLCCIAQWIPFALMLLKISAGFNVTVLSINGTWVSVSKYNVLTHYQTVAASILLHRIHPLLLLHTFTWKSVCLLSYCLWHIHSTIPVLHCFNKLANFEKFRIDAFSNWHWNSFCCLFLYLQTVEMWLPKWQLQFLAILSWQDWAEWWQWYQQQWTEPISPIDSPLALLKLPDVGLLWRRRFLAPFLLMQQLYKFEIQALHNQWLGSRLNLFIYQSPQKKSIL